MKKIEFIVIHEYIIVIYMYLDLFQECNGTHENEEPNQKRKKYKSGYFSDEEYYSFSD